MDNSLGQSDLTPAVREKLNKVGTGETGPAGPAGAEGPAGAAGKDGVSGLAVDGQPTAVPKGFSTLKLECAAGKKEISGGAKWDSGSGTPADLVLNGSYPTDVAEADGAATATSWTVALTNNDPKGEIKVQPFVTCATAN